MKEGENIKIDQSIKLYSWNTHFPQDSQDPTRQLFQKYAAQEKPPSVSYDPTEELNQVGTQQSQVKGLETGFRKLKNQQIEKLKDLRSEYEQIKKIATDYNVPKISKNSSMHSSSHSNSQVALSQKGSKIKAVGSNGREVQILELEKKQLETMVQNSMRKIQELLHNQMGYKKAIHELKLQRDSKGELQFDSSAKQYRKKQKQYTEQIRVLELQRETLLSTISGYKEKVKYLQSNVSNCDQQLRKLLDEKRNYQELIRVEKDKFMNLEIEFKRQKRQHDIIEKDKTAQINYLLKLKDGRESTSEKELKNAIASLQEDVKTKDKRYALLLEQWQTFQKERAKQDKQQEAKIVNDILNKSSNDPQNKMLQQTISNILQRIDDLEKKPIIEIDQIMTHHLGPSHQETIQEMQKRMNQVVKSFESKIQQNKHIVSQNYDLKESIQKLQRQIIHLQQNEADNLKIIETLKKKEKVFRKQRSYGVLSEIKSNNQDSFLNNSVNIEQNKGLEVQIQVCKKQKINLVKQIQSLQNQNRELRMKISKLQFQVDKVAKEAQFQYTLDKKSVQADIQILNKQIVQLRQFISQKDGQSLKNKRQYEETLELRTREIQQLKSTVDQFQRQKGKFDQNIQQNYTVKLKKLSQEKTAEITVFTTTIQNLNVQMSKLQQQNQHLLRLRQQNNQMIQYLHKMRKMNADTDQLWLRKQAQYQKVNFTLKTIQRS